jgi:peptidoglycan/LPS O-acetylase OafA/YrhL
MKINMRKLYLPLIIVFVVFSVAFLMLGSWLQQKTVDRNVLLAGNALLFGITLAALYFHNRGFLHSNVQVFLRSMYASLLVKMFVSVAAVALYAYIAGSKLNKPAIFICMGLYFVYTFVEVRMVLRLLKPQKKDG